jgi:ParB family chromosome partitioning protein
LLQQGALSEGHGRAVLLAEDHAARRSLAHAAATEGWSVRVTEERARESNAKAKDAQQTGRPTAPRTHPDQEQAAKDIAEALGGALGADVQVKPTRDGRYSAQLSFSTPEEALELARRIRPRVVA